MRFDVFLAALALAAFPLAAQDTKDAGPTRDADGFLWGTEVLAAVEDASQLPDHVRWSLDAVRESGLTTVKVRFQRQFFARKSGSFSVEGAMPSARDPRVRFDLDETVKLFKERGWSMVPMLSAYPLEVNDGTLNDYPEWVEWFVSRCAADADIRYVELVNCPVLDWKGTPAQLADANNLVYERVKKKHPEILVGTVGFEYWVDASDRSVEQVEYFLDPKNDVKFDFWAFHGYPLVTRIGAPFRPPTRKPTRNKYAGIPGIVEVRRRLDANGWKDRPMFDTEHVGIVPTGPRIDDERDQADAAYMVQELLLKRTLQLDGRRCLDGIIALKMYARKESGEFAFGSLKPDGSASRALHAVRVLLAKITGFKHAGHVSGEFDQEDVWVEKFRAGRKELYVFFKPFGGDDVRLDGKAVKHTLKLEKKPSSVTLFDASGAATKMEPREAVVLEAENAPKYLEVEYSE